MSLINDALKKAQKLQMQGQSPPPPHPGGAPNSPGGSGAPSQPAGSSRESSMPGQMFMLLAFGAGALIALSVLATVYLLRHPVALSPIGAAAPVVAQAPAAPTVPEKPAPAPILKAPPPALSPSNGPTRAQTASPPAPAQNFAPAPAPAFEKLPTPPSTTASAVPVTPAAPPALNSLAVNQLAQSLPNGSNPSNGLAPSSSSGSAQSLSIGLDPSKPDPKILAYLDALQVAGVRVSGTSNKALMNDRVFRENDIVDHLLGLRLKKIESDVLTFVDERGVVYTKNL